MAEIELGEDRVPSPMSAVSNAMVALHKEQFGRGPTRATSHFAGDDTIWRNTLNNFISEFGHAFRARTPI